MKTKQMQIRILPFSWSIKRYKRFIRINAPCILERTHRFEIETRFRSFATEIDLIHILVPV